MGLSGTCASRARATPASRCGKLKARGMQTPGFGSQFLRQTTLTPSLSNRSRSHVTWVRAHAVPAPAAAAPASARRLLGRQQDGSWLAQKRQQRLMIPVRHQITPDLSIHPLFHEHASERLHQPTDPRANWGGGVQHQPLPKQRWSAASPCSPSTSGHNRCARGPARAPSNDSTAMPGLINNRRCAGPGAKHASNGSPIPKRMSLMSRKLASIPQRHRSTESGPASGLSLRWPPGTTFAGSCTHTTTPTGSSSTCR